MEAIVDLDPREAADLIADQRGGAWLSAFTAELDRRLASEQLRRVMSTWSLSRSELGRLFGVSRQAVTKWLTDGPPTDRTAAVADLAGATDLLTRYVKRERIAAVVRRRASNLGGRSLLDLVATGDTAGVLAATRRMFAFANVHA